MIVTVVIASICRLRRHFPLHLLGRKRQLAVCSGPGEARLQAAVPAVEPAQQPQHQLVLGVVHGPIALEAGRPAGKKLSRRCACWACAVLHVCSSSFSQDARHHLRICCQSFQIQVDLNLDLYSPTADSRRLTPREDYQGPARPPPGNCMPLRCAWLSALWLRPQGFLNKDPKSAETIHKGP